MGSGDVSGSGDWVALLCATSASICRCRELAVSRTVAPALLAGLRIGRAQHGAWLARRSRDGAKRPDRNLGRNLCLGTIVCPGRTRACVAGRNSERATRPPNSFLEHAAVERVGRGARLAKRLAALTASLLPSRSWPALLSRGRSASSACLRPRHRRCARPAGRRRHRW